VTAAAVRRLGGGTGSVALAHGAHITIEALRLEASQYGDCSAQGDCHVEAMPSVPLASTAVHRAWLFVAARGAVAVAVAAFVLTRPGMGRDMLLGALGAYLFVDGLLALGIALRAERGAAGRGRYIIEGLLSLIVGALAFARPAAMASAVLMLVGARSIITGLVEIATAISLRKSGGGETHWPIGVGGFAALGFGAFLLVRPASGALLLVLLAGLYIMIFGLSLIGAAFRLHRAYGRLRTAG